VANDNPNEPTKRKRKGLAKVEPINKKQPKDKSETGTRPKVPYLFDPVPTEIIRKWMPTLTLYEMRCYLYIADHTWGYRKEWDEISISQFCQGRKNAAGEYIDHGIGRGRTVVKKALDALYLLGLIRIRRHVSKGNSYALTLPSHIKEQAALAAEAEKARRAAMPPDIGKHKEKKTPLPVAL
jgi:hypothetical protein